MRMAAFLIALTSIALQARAATSLHRYCTPEQLALSPSHGLIYVTCSSSDEVLAIDAGAHKVRWSIRVGRRPLGIAVDARTGYLYVANSWADSVTEIDPSGPRKLREFAVGWAHGLALDEGRQLLYCANRLSGTVSAVDLKSGRPARELAVGRGTSHLFRSPGSRWLYATKIYPDPQAPEAPPRNSVVVIDTADQTISHSYNIADSGAVFQGAAAGELILAPVIRPKNLLPVGRADRGSVFVNGITLLGAGTREGLVLPLDSPGGGVAQPFQTLIHKPTGRVFVSASGSDEVAVLSARGLLQAARSARSASSADDLSLAESYILRRIPTGRQPRAMTLGARYLYVANRLDDTVSVIDTADLRARASIRLTPEQPLPPARRGERHFHDARYSRGRQFSCSSCHIDGLSDGLTWDLAPDGFGLDHVATPSMEALAESAPYKWSGSVATLEIECGTLAERFFFRSEGFRGAVLNDVVAYLKSVPTRWNRYRPSDGNLTPIQRRGKYLFERKIVLSGRPILTTLQCPTCHYGPALTDKRRHDVGTQSSGDRSAFFDTPVLTNLAYKVTYLHNGSAENLHALWLKHNRDDLHGVTSDLALSDIDALVEYLKTL